MTTEQDQIETRAKLEEARRQDTCVVIRYQAPTASRPTLFLLFPKIIVHHGGHWYVDGWAAVPSRRRPRRWSSGGSGQQRRFRLDRMLAVELCVPPRETILGKVLDRVEYQFATRGPIGALVGLFLDLLTIASLVIVPLGLLFQLWRWISG